MKKLIIALALVATVAMGASAQKAARRTTTTKKATTTAAAKSVDNVAEGKKWFTAERYEKALPYLKKAVEAGDIDSKVRLAYMIFTAQVPDYSMDQDEALQMLDECIEQGSVYALERKGFCIIAMSADTKDEKLKGVACLEEASQKGNGDASAELFKTYQEGLKSYATGEFYIEPNDSTANSYLKLAAEQGSQTGKAYAGLYTYKGTNGFEKNAEEGVKLMEESLAMGQRFFTTDCFEPAKELCAYYEANGQSAKAAPIMALLKKYHPTEF